MKIIFEDKNLAVLDKPTGMLVHPTNTDEKNIYGEQGRTTTVDFIIKEWPEIKNFNWPPLRQGFAGQADKIRPGIVHRLDKDTSGLILIAKNLQTQKFLQDQFKNHKIQKTYLALVLGKIKEEKGIIKTQISRDQKDRTTQKTTHFTYSWQKQKSRLAETKYYVVNYYRFNNTDFTLLKLEPKTGRMHQLRIHCQYLGHPIIGDQKYNNKESRELSKKLDLSRQFLHAQKLEFEFFNGAIKKFQSKLPRDLQKIICKLSVL